MQVLTMLLRFRVLEGPYSGSLLRAPLKTVLFRDGGVSPVLTAFGAHKLGALRTVRPHVFAHTLRFSARGFLPLTKNAWF